MAYRRRIVRRRAPRRRYAPRRRAAPRRAYAPRRRAYPRRRVAPRRRHHRRRYGNRTVMTNRVARTMTTRTGDLVISHMEYIGDLIPSTNGSFLSQVYPINAALPSVFPWLSGLADNYEQYDFLKLEVILKTTSGNAFSSTNAATGTMGMCYLTNVYQPTNTVSNKVIAESYTDAKSGNPAKSQVMRINTKHGKNPLDTYFCRSGSVPAGQTLNMTDVCNLVVWSSSLQTNTASAISEIWLKYVCVLKNPRPGAGQLGFNILTAKYQYSSTVSATVPTSTNFWGGSGGNTTFSVPGTGQALNGLLANSNNAMNLLFANPSGSSSFQFPVNIICGNYLVVIRMTGTNNAAGNVAATTVSYVNATGTSYWGGALLGAGTGSTAGGFATESINASAGSNTGVTFCLVLAVTITASPASVVLTGPTYIPSTITSMDIMVSQFNGMQTTIT